MIPPGTEIVQHRLISLVVRIAAKAGVSISTLVVVRGRAIERPGIGGSKIGSEWLALRRSLAHCPAMAAGVMFADSGANRDSKSLGIRSHAGSIPAPSISESAPG